MLTPQQVKDYEFKPSGRNAYKADDVDSFIAELTIDYEKMFRENAELLKRINLLADMVEQYKNEESNIKEAVVSAQKAADLIIKDAKASVADASAEAEAILNAAKSEAEIIKSDAEKQAAADSELMLSMTRDKAKEIIREAKNEAANIILDANSSAKDKVGEATRTITSETLHFEMLQKEVSDFKASILSQYKAHIELLSKLPEIAEEKAKEIASDEASVNKAVEDISVDASVEYAEDVEEAEDVEDGVVKTTLPYDFFTDDGALEFVEENTDGKNEEIDFSEDIISENSASSENITDEKTEVSSKDSDFSLDAGFDFKFEDLSEDSFYEQEVKTESDDEITSEDENEAPASDSEDIPVSKSFSIDKSVIEKLDDSDIETEEKKEKRFGFFKRKK